VSIYFMELYKLFKKKIVWILLIVSLLPFLYASAMYFNLSFISINVQDKFNCIDYAYVMWNLIIILGLPTIMYLLIGSNTVSSELEGGQMRMLLTRICSRKKLLVYKFLAISTLVSIFCITCLITSTVAYYLFVVKTSYANGMFLSEDTLAIISSVLLSNLEILFLIALTFLFGIRMKSYSTFLVTLGIFIVLKIFGNVPYLKVIMPGYISGFSNFVGLSSGSLLLKLAIYFILLMIYIFFTFKMTLYKFNRMDVS